VFGFFEVAQFTTRGQLKKTGFSKTLRTNVQSYTDFRCFLALSGFMSAPSQTHWNTMQAMYIFALFQPHALIMYLINGAIANAPTPIAYKIANNRVGRSFSRL
jgi:hypothetical protein